MRIDHRQENDLMDGHKQNTQSRKIVITVIIADIAVHRHHHQIQNFKLSIKDSGIGRKLLISWRNLIGIQKVTVIF